MSQIKDRQIPGDQSRDPSIVELLTYNEKAGARKSINIGAALIPIFSGGAFTTDASATPLSLPAAGQQLAIFNKSTSTAYAVTVGDSTMTAQAIGAVQVSGSNAFVGVPCPANSWTYLSSGQWSFVATNNTNLVVLLVDDPTYMVTQPANNSSSVIFPQGSGNV
jgi:hypothetical protein